MTTQTELLDRKQLAIRLNVCEETIDRWRKSNRIPEPIINQPYRYRWSIYHIDAWLGKDYAKSGIVCNAEQQKVSSE